MTTPNTTTKKMFTAQIDVELLNAFKSSCEGQDTTASQAVRAFMRDYVRKNGQQDLFKTTSKRGK